MNFRNIIAIGVATLCSIGGLGCSPSSVTIPSVGTVGVKSPGNYNTAADVPGVGQVRYGLHVPASYDDTQPVPLVLILHYGYQGNRPSDYTGSDMLEMFAPGLSQLNAILIAPDVIGGDWRTPANEQAAVWLAKSVANSYKIDPQQILITGYSMGGEGTWFIGSRHQDFFTGAMPVAAPVAGGTDWKIPVYAIHSKSDEVVPFADAERHVNAIRSSGGPSHLFSVTGLEHFDTDQYGAFLADAIDWIDKQ